MRTILISGASSGIGLSIALRELQNGNRVSLGIRNLNSIENSSIAQGKWPKDQLIYSEYDALNEITAKEWLSNTYKAFNGFDTLINSAGILSKVPFLFEEGDEEEINLTMQVNFLAVWQLCRLSWEALTASNNGRIINK